MRTPRTTRDAAEPPAPSAQIVGAPPKLAWRRRGTTALPASRRAPTRAASNRRSSACSAPTGRQRARRNAAAAPEPPSRRARHTAPPTAAGSDARRPMPRAAALGCAAADLQRTSATSSVAAAFASADRSRREFERSPLRARSQQPHRRRTRRRRRLVLRCEGELERHRPASRARRGARAAGTAGTWRRRLLLAAPTARRRSRARRGVRAQKSTARPDRQPRGRSAVAPSAQRASLRGAPKPRPGRDPHRSPPTVR